MEYFKGKKEKKQQNLLLPTLFLKIVSKIKLKSGAKTETIPFFKIETSIRSHQCPSQIGPKILVTFYQKSVKCSTQRSFRYEDFSGDLRMEFGRFKESFDFEESNCLYFCAAFRKVSFQLSLHCSVNFMHWKD